MNKHKKVNPEQKTLGTLLNQMQVPAGKKIIRDANALPLSLLAQAPSFLVMLDEINVCYSETHISSLRLKYLFF